MAQMRQSEGNAPERDEDAVPSRERFSRQPEAIRVLIARWRRLAPLICDTTALECLPLSERILASSLYYFQSAINMEVPKKDWMFAVVEARHRFFCTASVNRCRSLTERATLPKMFPSERSRMKSQSDHAGTQHIARRAFGLSRNDKVPVSTEGSARE